MVLLALFICLIGTLIYALPAVQVQELRRIASVFRLLIFLYGASFGLP